MPLSAVVIHILVIERPSGVFVILSPAITPREPMGRTRVRHFDRVCATERPRERVRRCVRVCVRVRVCMYERECVCARMYAKCLVRGRPRLSRQRLLFCPFRPSTRTTYDIKNNRSPSSGAVNPPFIFFLPTAVYPAISVRR